MHITRRTAASLLLAVSLVAVLASCGNDPQRIVTPASQPLLISYDGGCWPISEDCQDRGLTLDEWNRIYDAIGLIEGSEQMCFDIRDKAMEDLVADRMRYWTVGPSGYSVDDYYGDRHNVPGITHITHNGFATTDDLIETVAHETAHALGYNHDDIDGLCGISLA